MVKGGKVSSKRRVKPRIRSDYKGSDDSDEDYVVSDEEKLVSEDLEEDYCSSLDGNASEESLGSFAKEEEEESWGRKNSRSRAKKGVGRSRAKKGIDRSIEDEEVEDELEEQEQEEEDEEEMKKVRKNGRSRVKKGKDIFIADDEEDELEEEEEEEEKAMKEVRKNGRSRVKKGKDIFIADEEEDELEEQEEEEEDEEEMKKVRKNGRSRVKKGKDIFIAEEEEDELEEEEEEEEKAMKEVRKVARSQSQNGFSGRPKNRVKTSQKRRRATYEDMADEDYDDDEDDDDDYDEESDEDDFSESEEESRVKKKKTNVKMGKRRLKKKVPVRRKSKKPLRKKQKKNRTLRRKIRSDDDDGDFMDSNLPVREKNKKKRPNKRRFVAPSDSDFVSSGSSDCDYTISEEEREQVREARQLCGSLEPNFRSSILPDKIQENEIVQLPRKPPGRKGKEKVEQVKVEVVKQVCGICLSEEDKRRVRGTLDCCTHYFCFSCIMEWGKVESRCPLCKQRFKAISKPTRAGTDLRDVVITVPERDQVYQPTEEELRSYLDPYENVICTECHEGGEDGLMLLCDVCDSPAHTYCVGLGRVVPEGNWYCNGCRPVALGSSSSQVQGWLPEQRTTNNILPNRQPPAVSFGEGLEIDLNSVSSPRSYIPQGFGNSSSPWFHVGGFQVASPGSGAGAPTLSGRRLMHRHIQQLITASRMNYLASRNERNSSANLSTDVLNAQTAQGRETVVQHTRTDGMDRSFHTFIERLQENPSLQVQDNDIFLSTSSHQRRQVVQDPTTTSADRPSNGTLWPGLTENTISGPPHFSSISDGGLSPNTVMGPSDFHRAKEQLQSLVISHVKNLSRDRDLGQSSTTFQEIARSAMHTVLAACELEHTGSEVVPVPPSSPCPHIELMAGKTSLMRGCCSSCFAQFVEDVVKRVMEYRLPPWLRLAL